jgi:hypothetical protein
MNAVTLDQVLDIVIQLPVEQQEMLIRILRKRQIESRRRRIAQDARDSLAMFRAGKLKPQPVQQVINDLRQALSETDAAATI